MVFPGENRRYGRLMEGFARRSEWFRPLRVWIFFA
jgi:hypothetical protein